MKLDDFEADLQGQSDAWNGGEEPAPSMRNVAKWIAIESEHCNVGELAVVASGRQAKDVVVSEIDGVQWHQGFLLEDECIDALDSIRRENQALQLAGELQTLGQLFEQVAGSTKRRQVGQR